jgi:hypothetical protein
MHASSVNAKNEYWDKYRIPMGLAEVFSIFLERLTKNSDYIKPLIDSQKNNNHNLERSGGQRRSSMVKFSER